MSPTREQLYAEIWSEPITAVARRYGVSNTYLARICDDLRVPKPPRGFWQRRAAGFTPEVPALPPLRPGDPSTWRMGASAIRPLEAPPDPPPRRGRLPAGHRPHPLIVEARDAYSHRRNPTSLGYAVPKRFTVMDLLVTESTLARALKAADALFSELEHRGHRVVLADGYVMHRPPGDEMHKLWKEEHSHRRPTVTFVGDTAFGLTLVEIGDVAYMRYDSEKGHFVRTARQWHHEGPPHHWVPNGRLALLVYAPYKEVDWSRWWTETRQGELPEMFADVIAAIEGAEPEVRTLANEALRRAEERRKEHEIEMARLREKWAREEQERRRKELQQQREAQLEDLLSRWRRAREIRAFIGIRAATASPRAEIAG